ncbi:hypothetical protein EV127DRAFT_325745, partial [Xylaria flabelliformis]
GADMEGSARSHSITLYLAVVGGNGKLLRLLISRKTSANMDAPSEPFGTPIQIDARRGDKEIVQLLLDKGADVNAKEGCFGTALSYATR